jgi:hypothetical protein
MRVVRARCHYQYGSDKKTRPENCQKRKDANGNSLEGRRIVLFIFTTAPPKNPREVLTALLHRSEMKFQALLCFRKPHRKRDPIGLLTDKPPFIRLLLYFFGHS